MTNKDNIQTTIDTEVLSIQEGFLKEGPTLSMAKKLYRLGSRVPLQPDQQAQIRSVLASYYRIPRTLNSGNVAKEADKSIESCLYLEDFGIDPRGPRAEFINSIGNIQTTLPVYLDSSASKVRFTFHHFTRAARNSAIQLHLFNEISELGIVARTKSRRKDPLPAEYYVPARNNDERITELFGISQVLKGLYADPELAFISPFQHKSFLNEMLVCETTRALYQNSILLLPDMYEGFDINKLLVPATTPITDYQLR